MIASGIVSPAESVGEIVTSLWGHRHRLRARIESALHLLGVDLRGTKAWHFMYYCRVAFSPEMTNEEIRLVLKEALAVVESR